MLSERLRRPPVRGRGHTCTVGFLLTELAATTPTDDPGGEFVALVGALANREWSGSDLVKELEAEGHEVSIRHLRPHRTGQCTTANCSWPNAGLLPSTGNTQ